MTIYVDEAMIPAAVPNGSRVHRSLWCHLVSDEYDSADLHPFARRLGLKRLWFQYKSVSGLFGPASPPWMWHYDVTLPKRDKALHLGAIAIDSARLTEIMNAKKMMFSALDGDVQRAQRGRWVAIATGVDLSPPQEGLF